MIDHTKIHANVLQIEALLTEIKTQLATSGITMSMANTSEVADATQANPADFDQLKTLLESDSWPEAVNPHLICDLNSTTDKTDRAKGIIELMIEEDLKGLKFLDIGCGEGHTAIMAANYGTTKSVGFDINKSDNWATSADPNVVLTTDPNVVASNGELYQFTTNDLGQLPDQAVISVIDKDIRYYWISCCNGTIHLISNTKVKF